MLIVICCGFCLREWQQRPVYRIFSFLIEQFSAFTGGTCLNNGDSNSCKSLQCTCGKCGKKLPNGYSCSTNDNCESGWCNGKVTIGCGGKCKRRHDDYEACPLNILGSGDNNICKSGRCEKVSGTTALCAPKVGFRAGTKCNEDTDCDKTKSLWCSGGSFYSSGKCTKCPDKCPDGCNALFNQNLKCGRMTTFDHAADLAKKIAKPIFDFVKCLAPEDIGCIADAGKGIIECLDTSTPCKIKIGGKGSTCLALNSAKQTFNYGTGMFIMDGDVEPTGGMSVEADITNGKINIELHGKVAVKVNAKFETTQSVNMPITKKKLYLTSCSGKRCTPCKTPQNANICRPLTLYTKVFMIGYIPVIVQVKVQIVAELFMKLKTTGSFKASISYENNAVVRIKKALVTFDPIKGVKFDVGFEDNFSTDIKKTLVVNAGVDLLAVARIGPEISVVVNGIPMKMMLAARFVMEGNLLLSQPACMTGSFSAGIGLDAGISADLSLPNPGELAGMACQSLVGAACKVPLVKVANCAVKVFTKVDPCKKAQGMCSDMAKEIAKLTPSNLGKGFTGTAIIINAKFVPFNLTGKTYCVSGQTKFYSKAGKYGSGTLSGGGGGNGIKTCGAPGVSKCGMNVLLIVHGKVGTFLDVTQPEFQSYRFGAKRIWKGLEWLG